MQPSAISIQLADSSSQSYVVMIEHAPTNTELGLRALEQVRNLIADQHRIEQVFFYAAGVLYANCFLDFPSGLPNLQSEWLQLAEQHDFPLVVCATVGSQYGVNALPLPQGNLQAGFAAGGLAEFIGTLSAADQFVQL